LHFNFCNESEANNIENFVFLKFEVSKMAADFKMAEKLLWRPKIKEAYLWNMATFLFGIFQ
jgi:hypothetical protein